MFIVQINSFTEVYDLRCYIGNRVPRTVCAWSKHIQSEIDPWVLGFFHANISDVNRIRD